MTPEDLSSIIVDALSVLEADGALTLPDGVPTTVTVERPRQKGHGDYATNVALQLAKRAGTNPRALGELLAERLRTDDGIADVEVAGPGFLNISVEAGASTTSAPQAPPTSSRQGRRTARPTLLPARRSTSSSCPPTPPDRCTSVGSAGRPSVTRWGASSR